MQPAEHVYESYARLRAGTGVHYSRAHRSWLVSTYADVASAFRDERIVTIGADYYRDRIPPESRAALEPLVASLDRWMLLRDPPDHERLRKVCARAFTPRMVERMTEQIATIVDELLADVGGTFELMTALAQPLPIIVIAEMIGAPRGDRALFRRWSDDFIHLFTLGDDLKTRWQAIRDSWQEMSDYLRALSAERRAAPKNDLTSALIGAESAETISDEEVVQNLVLLLIAGNETTINLIGNGVHALLRNREQWEDWRDHPEIARSAVEELLRFDSPVQSAPRVAREDLVIGGQAIRAGEDMTLLIGSANHDPAVFEEADRLRLRRTPNAHLTFGLGIHYCLGAPLARLEGHIAVRALMQRFPELALVEETADWRIRGNFRGLASLTVTDGPRPARA
jgi:cytochrome P450